MTRRWGPTSLVGRIVGGTLILFAAAMLLGSLVVGIALRANATAIVDQQVAASELAFERVIVKNHGSPHKPLSEFIGQGPGSVIVLLTTDDRVIDAARFTEDGGGPVPAEALATVGAFAESADRGRTQDLALPGLGSFRATVDEAQGRVLVTAVSTSAVDAAIGLQTAVNAGVAALAMVALAVGATILVRLMLRPLTRVATAAKVVARSPLRDDDTRVPRPLDDRDLRDRSEVGEVGRAFDLLLDNVDDAIQYRVAVDRRMRQFLTDASHELRTPLASIRGYAELTRQDSAALPPTTEYSLSRIESEAARMARLVDNLLLLARLDEEDDLQLDDVDLADIAAAAVSDASAAFPDHSWTAELPDGPAIIRGDTERLHQLMANLLANAGTHTPPGTTTTVRVETGEPGSETARLIVADDGPGIPPERAAHLFERFNGRHGGDGSGSSSGLGLSIVKAIVDAHRGSIAYAEDRSGTTFTIRLPAPPAAADGADATASPGGGVG
ncbi:HAMP domain-containing sensor histidine kinase [Streptomyces sp. MS2A]|nr:HAMP domain-containing sensor histidine kinase [Streptomyces sp. MS2A]